jgi:hypothetical protein
MSRRSRMSAVISMLQIVRRMQVNAMTTDAIGVNRHSSVTSKSPQSTPAVINIVHAHSVMASTPNRVVEVDSVMVGQQCNGYALLYTRATTQRKQDAAQQPATELHNVSCDLSAASAYGTSMQWLHSRQYSRGSAGMWAHRTLASRQPHDIAVLVTCAHSYAAPPVSLML